MTDFVPLVAFGGLTYALVQFIKQLVAKNWNAVLIQLAAWISGVSATLLGSATQFASGISVGHQTLSGLSIPSQIFVGLTVAGTASTAYSLKQAIDNTDTDVVPVTPATETPTSKAGNVLDQAAIFTSSSGGNYSVTSPRVRSEPGKAYDQPVPEATVPVRAPGDEPRVSAPEPWITVEQPSTESLGHLRDQFGTATVDAPTAREASAPKRGKKRRTSPAS